MAALVCVKPWCQKIFSASSAITPNVRSTRVEVNLVKSLFLEVENFLFVRKEEKCLSPDPVQGNRRVERATTHNTVPAPVMNWYLTKTGSRRGLTSPHVTFCPKPKTPARSSRGNEN